MDGLLVQHLSDVPEIASWLERRRAIGADHADEVWEGVYHVTPHANLYLAHLAMQVIVALGPRAASAGLRGIGEFNLGDQEDFRVPDGGWFSGPVLRDLFAPTATIVLEVLSPGDQTFAKFEFFAKHGVREILVVDPEAHTVACFSDLGTGSYTQVEVSAFVGVTMQQLHDEINWA